MNTNELMLGDYVHSDRFNENWIITDLNEYGVWLNGDYRYRHHANEISPIPLTDEIMSKNFPDDEPGYGIGWRMNKDDGSVSVDYTDLNENIVILPTVRYFHELQHILHLVESSKTIEP